jgi:hypothetical protein
VDQLCNRRGLPETTFVALRARQRVVERAAWNSRRRGRPRDRHAHAVQTRLYSIAANPQRAIRVAARRRRA